MRQLSFSMKPRTGWMLFGIASFIFSSLWLLPLSVVGAMFGLAGTGLAARTVDGTGWNGRMFDVGFMGTQVGDIQLKLLPFDLLAGTARFRLDGAGASGEGYVGVAGRGVRNIDASLIPSEALRSLGLEAVRLTGMSVRYEGGRCAEANGQMTAFVASGPLARAAGPQLSGPATCVNGDISFQLTDAGGKAVFNLDYPARAAPRFTILLKTSATLDKQALGALGFVETPVGLRRSGQLPD